MKNIKLNNNLVDKNQLTKVIKDMKKISLDKPLTVEQRISAMETAIRLLKNHAVELSEAYSADFGHRAIQETLLSDVYGSIAALEDAKENVAQWSKTETRQSPYPNTKAYVEYQPLGLVGIMSPWNFPLVLTFAPMASALAAGNRIVIKPSEFTEKGSALLCKLVSEYFDPNIVSSIQGDASVSALFSSLEFDHIIFTGSTAVGKKVMASAANNLTSLTLELGGKSPVIISDVDDIGMVADRIMTVKAYNAGQICISPDYVLIKEEHLDDFISKSHSFLTKTFGSFIKNKDYTSIITQPMYDRLVKMIDEAKSKGLKVIKMSEEDNNDQDRRLIPTLIINPGTDTLCMQEEIFGPILPVVVYKDIDDAINYIREFESPLAIYYFGYNQQEITKIKQNTKSGGVVINDVMTHVLINDLPFGGVGHSGMGAYHGKDGFMNMSNKRAFFEQSATGESNTVLRSPFDDKRIEEINKLINS